MDPSAKPVGLASESLPHQVQVRLGTVNTAQAKQGLKPGAVLSLQNEVGGQAIVEVNGTPVFVGAMGEVQGHFAVQITGNYGVVRDAVRREPGEFHQLEWPTASE